jgi:hypothetical protein
VNSGHQSFNDSVLIVDNLESVSAKRLWYLGERGETVSGAAGITNDFVFGLVGIEIDTTDEHGCVCGWSRDDDLLCSSLKMGGCLFRGGENSSRLDNVLIHQSCYKGYTSAPLFPHGMLEGSLSP